VQVVVSTSYSCVAHPSSVTWDESVNKTNNKSSYLLSRKINKQILDK
jgi:hypothetical protein